MSYCLQNLHISHQVFQKRHPTDQNKKVSAPNQGPG